MLKCNHAFWMYLYSPAHYFEICLDWWGREEGGGGFSVSTVQGLTCSTLWPQQYWGRQKAEILPQRPRWMEILPSSHRMVDTGEHNQRWHLPLLLQVFIMCLTRPLVEPSACLRARENLWSGFRGRSRTTKVCQWWLQLVQVFQKKPYVDFNLCQFSSSLT